MPIPRSNISRCTDSTIVEAWAHVIGVPGAISDTEAAVIRHRAVEAFPSLKRKPSIVAQEALGPLVAPFWTEQHSWNDDCLMARFGHRYLSVHFMRKTERRYGTYADTLEEPIARWVQLQADALGNAAGKLPVETVGFGYVNLFAFEPDGFDISRYFRFNIGVSIGDVPGVELYGHHASFNFLHDKEGLRLAVELTVVGADENVKRVHVLTKVLAEYLERGGTTFADYRGLTQRIHDAKEAAKATFFNFTMDETRVMMGAESDAPQEPKPAPR